MEQMYSLQIIFRMKVDINVKMSSVWWAYFRNDFYSHPGITTKSFRAASSWEFEYDNDSGLVGNSSNVNCGGIWNC